MTTVIEAEGLTKRFGATRALAGVDVSAERGRVLALLGPAARRPSGGPALCRPPDQRAGEFVDQRMRDHL
jgi:ABC-type polar amino acid transport system ATPase subunit